MIAKLLKLLSGFVIWTISTSGYAGILLLMAIESACIPLPSEVIMPFSGYLVFTGRFRLLWVATVGALGCNLGSAVAYWVGAHGGRPLVEKYGSWIFLSRRELDWADRFFQRYGDITVFLSRLLPVIRTFIAFPAGVARMPLARFHAYTFLGSWPWCLGLAWLGMKAGEHWDYLGKYFHKFDAVIGAGIALGVVWFVWTHWKHRVRTA
ncbi:MAG TPA: DedA family protein [Terriglobales bacterium]|nr:DedA family protein [Terriglobales bacterium]